MQKVKKVCWIKAEEATTIKPMRQLLTIVSQKLDQLEKANWNLNTAVKGWEKCFQILDSRFLFKGILKETFVA